MYSYARNRIIPVVIIMALASLLFFSGNLTASAATTYPDSKIEVKAGDIIYSPKGKSTFFVGHVAIVGSDGYVYHAYPNSDGKRRDTLSTYIDLFNKGDEFTVYRPKSSDIDMERAGKLAEVIYGLIESYDLLDSKLDSFKGNFCSKFVWQAYFFSSFVDITGQDLQYNEDHLIYPKDIANSKELKKVVEFKKK